MECDAHSDGKMKPVTNGVDKVLKRGHTAYLGDVSSLVEGMNEFLEQLTRELGIDTEKIRAGAFLSPAGNGASCHYDVLEVISVQLIGNKQFNIAPVREIRYPYGYQYCPESPPFDNLYPQISNAFPDFSAQEFEKIDMQPGSVLCMPRGTWHYTEADSDSLAMSIVLSPPNEMERLIEQLTATLLQSAEWRRPCYGLNAGHSVDYACLPTITDNIRQREENPQAPSRCFGEDSRFVHNPGARMDIRSLDRHFEIVIKGRTPKGKPASVRLEAPQHTADVFKWLDQQKGPFTVRRMMEHFAGLDAGIFEQILQVASDVGLVRFLWFDPVGPIQSAIQGQGR